MSSDPRRRILGQAPVLSSERKDFQVCVAPEQSHHTVHVEPGAVHHDLGPDVSGAGAQVMHVPLSSGRADLGPRSDFVARLRQEPRQGASDVAEIHGAGEGHPEPFDAAYVRLMVGDAVRADALGLHSVRPGAAFQLVERRDLIALRRDHHLAGLGRGDTVLATELEQPRAATDAELGLERTRRVIEPRVDDPAVASGLVGRDLWLFFEDDDGESGVGAPDRVGCRQPDDPAADDGDVGAAGSFASRAEPHGVEHESPELFAHL